MADETLEFELKATSDDAPVAQLTASLNALQKSVDANTASLSKNSDQTKKASTANDGMTASVFKGVASWALLSQAANAAKDFLEGSVSAFLDAQKSIDLTHATVLSMGQSLATAMPQLDAFGASMVRMGVDGEDAELAAARLAKAAGNDIPKGLQLAKLAADLASSGYGDLASNTDTLASVLAGRGTAAIKQYKLAIDDSATSAQILDAIQAKVTQTTEQYADTIPGKIQTVKQAYNELQQSVGEGLVASLNSAAKSSATVGDGLDLLNIIGQALKYTVYEVVEGFVAVAQVFAIAGTSINEVYTGFKALVSIMTGDVKGGMAELKSASDSQNEAFDALGNTLSKMAHPVQNLEAAQKDLASQSIVTAAAAGNVGDGIVNANKKAEVSYVSLADKLTAFRGAYTDLLQGASTDLASLADAHVSEMATISASIAKTQQAIASLTKSFEQQSVSDEAGIADTIVASQTKVADLKKQMAAAVTQDQYDQLKVQLDAEQKNLDSSSDFQSQHADAIAAAQQRASETDLQRSIDSYNAKRALALQEYNDQYSQLQQELADENAKSVASVALYNSRAVAIKKVLDAANADYITLSNQRIDQTTQEVNQEIALFQQLAAAISSVKSASVSAVGTIAVPQIPTTHKALGGSVMAGQSYIVGENGQEVFTPSMSGSITPNGGVGGGGMNITINMNGGYYLDDQVADKISDRFMEKLRRKTRFGL